MRIKVRPDKVASEDQLGKEREIRRFLLWPMKIGNEWRWLEHVRYREKVVLSHKWGGGFRGSSLITFEVYEWDPTGWIDGAGPELPVIPHRPEFPKGMTAKETLESATK